MLQCIVCKETINTDDRQHVRENAPHEGGYGRTWHFSCLPVESVIRRKLSLDQQQLSRWTTWFISQLIKPNTALRQKMYTLATEIARMMREGGTAEEDITNFLKYFAVYDDDLNPVKGTP